ncbi:MAG: hypothetical protein M4579_000223 [Chaenotheca gracillima]|nr:MAG: hypothetical protein M4579_000223 [Chaenotheca gracillima]
MVYVARSAAKVLKITSYGDRVEYVATAAWVASSKQLLLKRQVSMTTSSSMLTMALKLHIPPCIDTPAHPFHPPPLECPLRINIEGPLVSIQKRLPGIEWHLDGHFDLPFPQPAGRELARLTYQTIYDGNIRSENVGDLVVRDEYLGWVAAVRPLQRIDYYGVVFDHLVPADDPDPDVLQLNIIEMDDDDGEYARDNLRCVPDLAEHIGKKVLAVPRCCQMRKGTQDRGRVNKYVIERDEKKKQEAKIQSSSQSAIIESERAA